MNIIKVAVVGVVGLMLILLATQTPSWAEGTPVITHSSQVTRTKLGTFLPLQYTGSPGAYLYRLVRVAEIPVTDLQPGDLVRATASGQASTRDGITRAGHGRFLKATKTGSSAEREGLMLATPMGHNVTSSEHHSTLSASGSFVAGGDWSGSVKIIFIMYAYGLGLPTDSRSLSVDYVELTVDVTRLR